MIFKIKKGNHYSNRFLFKILNLFNGNPRMSNYVIFDDTAIYVDETIDKFDVNKLFGFSIGFHHNNSYRFGWNSFDGKIHIYAYAYVNKKRIIDEICVIESNKEYVLTINLKSDKCLFSVIDENDNIKQMVIDSPHKNIIGYKLWPYFGGNKTAPKKISINLFEH